LLFLVLSLQKQKYSEQNPMNIKDCTCCTPWCSTQTSATLSLVSKCHRVSQYTRKCNFIMPVRSTALPVLIFVNLTNARQHYVQHSYIKLHWTDLNETHRIPYVFVEIFCTEFYPNQTKNVKNILKKFHMPWDDFPSCFLPKLCIHFSSNPYIQQAPAISSFLIWSQE
jgi:hypothetical protein